MLPSLLGQLWLAFILQNFIREISIVDNINIEVLIPLISQRLLIISNSNLVINYVIFVGGVVTVEKIIQTLLHRIELLVIEILRAWLLFLSDVILGKLVREELGADALGSIWVYFVVIRVILIRQRRWELLLLIDLEAERVHLEVWHRSFAQRWRVLPIIEATVGEDRMQRGHLLDLIERYLLDVFYGWLTLFVC